MPTQVSLLTTCIHVLFTRSPRRSNASGRTMRAVDRLGCTQLWFFPLRLISTRLRSFRRMPRHHVSTTFRQPLKVHPCQTTTVEPAEERFVRGLTLTQG